MRPLVLFMHVSLDGYVAGPNGEMDWIKVDDELFDYAGNRTDESDTAFYGRVTWEMMDAYWPDAAQQPNASKHDIQHGNWYNKVEKVVLSRTMKDEKRPKTKFIGENVAAEIRKLKETPGKEIIMFGSPGAAKSLMKDKLIDEFWLFINPILVGKEKLLFEEMADQTKLKLVKADTFKSGVVCLHYKVS